jgi:splicing factor 3B subunit 3
VHTISIAYFDTIPVANSICVLKSGYLFSASEFGNHHFYSFIGLGESDPVYQDSNMKMGNPVQFVPRALLNLSEV